jgi:hypothetical protein
MKITIDHKQLSLTTVDFVTYLSRQKTSSQRTNSEMFWHRLFILSWVLRIKIFVNQNEWPSYNYFVNIIMRHVKAVKYLLSEKLESSYATFFRGIDSKTRFQASCLYNRLITAYSAVFEVDICFCKSAFWKVNLSNKHARFTIYVVHQQ